jgi:putative heme-binding domain-containing protein
MKQFLLVFLIASGLSWITPASADEGIDALVEVLSISTDAQLDLDILRGMRDGLRGSARVAMPKGWDAVEKRLNKSPNTEVRELAGFLAGIFGSSDALEGLRKRVTDQKQPVKSRRQALASLAEAKDAALFDLCVTLFRQPKMRLDALKAVSAVNHPKLPGILLELYPKLRLPAARRAVLNTMVSRTTYATALLKAIGDKRIPARDLTAELVRPLRQFKEPAIDQAVKEHWGLLRESPAERKQEIARYKKGLSDLSPKPGDLKQGRELFNLICGQCHTLFGVGGKVGPDITGSNRSDLDYLLHNILDPNAEIPNDYRTSNIETKDDRNLTGVITRQSPRTITLVTAAETLTLARDDIAAMTASELSMMPEGLLQLLNPTQVKQLIAYLQSPRQVE